MKRIGRPEIAGDLRAATFRKGLDTCRLDMLKTTTMMGYYH
jgi:hypothetical protein